MAGPDQPNGVELTPREREVLAMVAEGKTNREIGAALFISESTAGVHVSNILGKLGVSSRHRSRGLRLQDRQRRGTGDRGRGCAARTRRANRAARAARLRGSPPPPVAATSTLRHSRSRHGRRPAGRHRRPGLRGGHRAAWRWRRISDGDPEADAGRLVTRSDIDRHASHLGNADSHCNLHGDAEPDTNLFADRDAYHDASRDPYPGCRPNVRAHARPDRQLDDAR